VNAATIKMVKPRHICLIINYLNKFWTFMNDILGLFEVHETIRLSMDNYNLYLKIMI